jgi:hypothetical protein
MEIITVTYAAGQWSTNALTLTAITGVTSVLKYYPMIVQMRMAITGVTSVLKYYPMIVQMRMAITGATSAWKY